MRSFASMLSFTLDIIYPKTCFRCGTGGIYLCEACQILLSANRSQVCIICGRGEPGGYTHPKCQTKSTPERLITIFDYHEPSIAGLISEGKYQFIPEVFTLLGQIAATHINLPTTTALVAIPLSKQRKKWRGFNQAETIADSISKTLSLTKIAGLRKIKHTPTQQGQNKAHRKVNPQGCFEAVAFSNVYSPVVLVDDVCTTGSTFLEATKAIKRVSRAPIWCLALARD